MQEEVRYSQYGGGRDFLDKFVRLGKVVATVAESNVRVRACLLYDGSAIYTPDKHSFI